MVTIETLRELTDLTLDLWALSFNHATHSRRRNILKVTEAELLLLLNNADHFSDDQNSYLFGEKFVTAMRNQATHMVTLQNVKRVVNQPTRGHSNPQKFSRNNDYPFSTEYANVGNYGWVSIKIIGKTSCTTMLCSFRGHWSRYVGTFQLILYIVADGTYGIFY